MSRALGWSISVLIAFAALVGLISLFNSRDDSDVAQHTAVTSGPGERYTGEPVLSPALQDAVRRGNVVVLYRDDEPPPGTKTLVPPGGKALEDAGQSVVLEREPTLRTPLAAVSAKRIQAADTPGELSAFVDYWVGGR